MDRYRLGQPPVTLTGQAEGGSMYSQALVTSDNILSEQDLW